MAAPLPEWADVTAIAPELSVLRPEVQAALIQYAIGQCNATTWGVLVNNAIVYLAAHMGTLARMRGTGVVTEESVGQLSRSYSTPQGIRGSLGLTAYGAEFKRLIKSLPSSIGAVF